MNNARLYLYGFCSFMCGCCFGWVMLTIYAPDPLPANDCYTYKISEQVVTSYVLKPPPAEHPVPALCPVAPKCEEAPKVEEARLEEEPKAERPQKHKRRRHYASRRSRVRATW